MERAAPVSASGAMDEAHELETDGQTDDMDSADDAVREAVTALERNDFEDDGNGSEAAACEVFIGGLAPDVADEDVRLAFEAAGPVVHLRLNRRNKTGECKGFGFIRFADASSAERAIADINQVGGRPVGVFSSRGRTGDVKLSPALGDDNDPDSSLSKLFELIRSYPDTKMAVNAALKAVMKLPQRPQTDPENRMDDPSSQAGDRPGSRGESSHESFRRRAEDDVPLPDPNKFLEQYPKTRQLVETFRANPNTHNKTPLAILHEYATRLNLELTYLETSSSNLGPFTVEAKLSSVGGAVLYAKGIGRGRGKKDAKQVGAAAVLEVLLQNIAPSDFTQPGKSKQMKDWERSQGLQGPGLAGSAPGYNRGTRPPPRGSRPRPSWNRGQGRGELHPGQGFMPFPQPGVDYGGPWYGPSADFPMDFDFSPNPGGTRFSDIQDPTRRSAGGMLSPLSIAGASGAQQYPPRIGPGPQHFQPEEGMGIYGQPGGFGLGGVGHDVPGLHPDVTMRPALAASGIPGLGMSFGSTPVSAGIHDPSVSTLGHGLQDASLQGHGPYGIQRQIPPYQ